MNGFLMHVCLVGLSSLFCSNYYHGYGGMSQATLQSAINSGHGIVVNVRNGGHWVLVTGHAGGSTYTVNDPGFSVGSYTYGEMVRWHLGTCARCSMFLLSFLFARFYPPRSPVCCLSCVVFVCCF
jgi:hypothetical protein